MRPPVSDRPAISGLRAVRGWPRRRWAVAVAVSALFAVVVAVPTDLIDTPLFWREIPPTWWAWPALAVTSVLVGLLAASYVAPADGARSGGSGARPTRGGYVGGLLTFVAVGCPVCNKLVLLALGSAGALTWFEPLQPALQVAAIALLVWALRTRLRGEISCRVPPDPATEPRPAADVRRVR